MVGMHIPVMVCALFFFMSYSRLFTAPSRVTYTLNGGRFGDNLRSFTQAYWLAYAYDLNFLYVPFTYSEKLKMHRQCTQYEPSQVRIDAHATFIFPGVPVHIKREDFLYITTYSSAVEVDWCNKAFKDAVTQLIAPQEQYTLPDYVKNGIVIHVRTGGDYYMDTDQVKYRNPAHFPDFQYYANALVFLLKKFPGHHDVCMCTDDLNPESVVQNIMMRMPADLVERVTVHYDLYADKTDAGMLKDFTYLQHARFLIRPESNFSLYAQLLGVHEWVIAPKLALPGNPYGKVTSALITHKSGTSESSILKKDGIV